MRAVAVVVVDVGREDSFQVAAVEDQDPVEASRRLLPIQRSMKCSRGARSVAMTDRLERKTSSKAAVNLLSRSWIRTGSAPTGR